MLRRLRHLGLRAAVFGSFGLALLLLLLVAWGLIRMQVLTRVNDRVEASGRLLARHVANWLAHSDEPAQVLAEVPLATASVAGMALVNASGRVEAVSHDTLDWASTTARWEASGRLARVALPDNQVLLAEPAQSRGATVLVVVDERFIEDVKAGLRSGLALSVLVGVLVFAAGMALVSRFLFDQPLERMTAMAHRLAEGDLSQGLEEGGRDRLWGRAD